MDETLAYRRALGAFATGVAVVAADAPAGPVGITVNSFTSVSLRPRLILWCLDEASDRYPVFAQAPLWGVTVLAAGDAERSSRFATGDAWLLEPGEADRLAGAPALRGGIARFAARTTATATHGDHLVIIGEVLAFEAGPGEGLTFFRGRYGVTGGEQI